MTKDRMIELLIKSRIDAANEVLKAFKDKFEQDPLHAFADSERCFEATACLFVWKKIHHFYFDLKRPMETVIDDLKTLVLNEAKYPSPTSSMATNLMETMKLNQHAQAIYDLENI